MAILCVRFVCVCVYLGLFYFITVCQGPHWRSFWSDVL